MFRFASAFLVVFALWTIFTLSPQPASIMAGVLVSAAVAWLTRNVMFRKSPLKFLHPVRVGAMIFYVIVLVYEEIKSNLDVAYRIITGRIRPALVEVQTDLKTDAGKALLGNSITITPGTLTIRADSKLLVHWIAYDKKRRPGLPFEKIGKVIFK